MVHKDALSRGYWGRHGVGVVTNVYLPEGEPCAFDLARFVSERSEGADFCITLVDRRWEALVANYRTACFVVPFDMLPQNRNFQNFFQSLTTSSLRILGQVAAKFDKGRDAELLTLPLRNFHADELREIAGSVAGDVFVDGLADTIESHLSRLRKRVRPRRQSNRKTLYAVDDRKRFFSYGHERHAAVETGADHTSHCVLCAKFRFGRKIDAARHYNVSETEGDRTSLNGEFANCHDVIRPEKRDTHLNMFANDMYY